MTNPIQRAIMEARKQALLDAAGVLRSWIDDFGREKPTHLSAQAWVQAAMSDCIGEIEEMTK